MVPIRFFLFAALCLAPAPFSSAADTPDLTKKYQIFSPYYNVPGQKEKNVGAVNYRFAWTNKAPYMMAVQFTNSAYKDLDLKFAIKDKTHNKRVLLDPANNAYFVEENLSAESDGAIWAGEVDDLTSEFFLKVWYPDGDSFEQAPITIMANWTAKPPVKKFKPKPTSTPTLTPVTQAPPGANTFTPTATPSSTATLTATYTPTICQTPAPVYPAVFAAIGDSYMGGEGASDASKAFVNITWAAIQKWYPGTIIDLFALPGTEALSWVNGMPVRLKEILKAHRSPIAYVLFQTGPGCFYFVHDAYRDDCCKGATAAEGVSYSYNYQKHMDEAIGDIYNSNPDVNLVVMGIPDSTGGAGHYAPPEVYEAYRDRLFELQKKYPRMRIADVYTVTKDHADWFHHNDDNKDHANNKGQEAMGKCIVDQFAYWVYKPSKPWVPPTPEPTDTPTATPAASPNKKALVPTPTATVAPAKTLNH